MTVERLKQNRFRILIEREPGDLKRRGTSPTNNQGPNLSNLVLFNIISQMSKLEGPIKSPPSTQHQWWKSWSWMQLSVEWPSLPLSDQNLSSTHVTKNGWWRTIVVILVSLEPMGKPLPHDSKAGPEKKHTWIQPTLILELPCLPNEQ